MFDSLREAAEIVDENPVMIVFGIAIAALEALQYGLRSNLSFVVDTVPLPRPAVTLVLIENTALVFGLVPLVGLFVLSRDALDGEGVSTEVQSLVSRTADAARRHYLRLLGATIIYSLASLVFAVVLAIALHAVALVVDTTIRFGAYALGEGFAADPMLMVKISAALLTVSLIAGGFPFAFYDVLIVFADGRPSRSWATSFRFAVAYPRRLLGYGVVTALLVGPPMALANGITLIGSESYWTATGALVYMLLGGIAQTLAGAYHVAFFERRVAPTVCEDSEDGSADTYELTGLDRPMVTRRVRTLLVVLLVTGLVAGSVGVRVADVRPGESVEPTPVDASTDPQVMLENGQQYATGVSHREVYESYAINTTADDRELAS